MNRKNIFLVLFLVLFSCKSIETELNKKNSIYEYANDEILGNPIRIHISEKENIIYKIESDTLIDSLNNILLFGGVNVQVFDEDAKKINDIYSDRAIVYSRSDSMSAFGKKGNFTQ